MTAVLLGREAQNSPAWDALRSNGLGGSEIAAVVGLSPWESRYSLYLRKRGELRKQHVNAGMSWGTRLEPVICDLWQELHSDVNLEEAGTYQHAERVWQLANVDRLITDDEFLDQPHGLLEVKTAHQYDAHEWGPHGSVEIPPYYRCQVLWYMDVLGVREAHVAVLIGGSDYREYVLPYVPDEAEWLREEGRKFWVDVTDGNRPPLDGSTATYEAVRKIHPLIERDVVADIDPDVYAAYATTKASADDAQTAHRQAKSVLLDQMGEAQRAHVNGVPVLRRQSGRGDSISLQPIPKKKAAA